MSIRTERLSALLKKDLGDIIQRDFQPSGTFVTVTQVRVTPDLGIAKVYLSVFAPGKDELSIMEYIDGNIQNIRKKLADRIRNQVRKIPELHFYPDDTSQYVNKMEGLFKKVEESRPEDDQTDEEE